jgi:SAM-dependent methyltransferase
VNSGHRQVYSEARCYDVAFGFRDIVAECDTLAALAMRLGGGPVSSVLELAAGPARHAREFARRGAAATALDALPSMCDYAAEQARLQCLSLRVVSGDMCDFELSETFDLALLLMDSISYVLDNDAAIRHLACVAKQLRVGGLYVLEMSHPRDVFGVGSSTRSQWTSELDGWRVDMRWGAEGDAFDPVTQIDEVTVSMDWSGPEGGGQLVEVARQRRFTANEIHALVRADGHFEIVERLGSLAPVVPFSNEPLAWRMVLILRKRGGSP